MLTMLLNPRLIATLAIGLVIVFGAKFSYDVGYRKAETKYQKLLQEFSLKAEKLRTREEVIKTEVLVQYKDKVRTIKEVETQIIYVTEPMLEAEAKQCVIGPNFIELHNRAATLK